MKRLFTFLGLFLLLTANAQWKINYDKEDNFTQQDEKRFSWGYFIGLNYYDFKITPKYNYGDKKDTKGNEVAGVNENGKFLVTSEPKVGFSAGLMGKLRLNDYFDLWLEPGIQFTERTLKFDAILGENYKKFNANYETKKEDLTRKIKSTYLDIPLSLQFHGDRWFNTRPYIQAGVGYSINLQSKEKSSDDNSGGIFRLKTYNFNWQAELGINIYFKRFKFTPAIKGIFFLNNELVPDNAETPNIWANTLSSLKTRAVVLSLKFE